MYFLRGPGTKASCFARVLKRRFAQKIVTRGGAVRVNGSLRQKSGLPAVHTEMSTETKQEVVARLRRRYATAGREHQRKLLDQAVELLSWGVLTLTRRALKDERQDDNAGEQDNRACRIVKKRGDSLCAGGTSARSRCAGNKQRGHAPIGPVLAGWVAPPVCIPIDGPIAAFHPLDRLPP